MKNRLLTCLGILLLSCVEVSAKEEDSQNNSFILEQTTDKFIQALNAKGAPPLYTLTPEQARKVLEDVQADNGKKLDVKIEDLTIPVGPKGSLGIRIIRPPQSTGPLPIIMFYHGAGWILGSNNTHDNLARALAVGSNAAVVFVDYSLAPEAQFPTQINEAYAATKYFAEQGQKHNLDTSRFVVVGDSVGGNMAIAVTLLAKERGGPRIDFQLLFYPVTSATFNTPSYQKYAEGPWLTKKAMEWFFKAYAPNVAERSNILISPVNATLEQLKGLPPALVITDENDVLRDEGEDYAHKLMQAGVYVTAVRFLGTIHDFVMLNALKDTPAAKGAILLANAYLKQAFNKENNNNNSSNNNSTK